MRLFYALLATAWMCGCGDDPGPTSPEPEPTHCGEAALEREDGSCVAIGVPADQCGHGFVASDDGGCTPVLPELACDEGEMALPGDGTCRPPAGCGAGKWGDIPLEPSTLYVEAGASGDGSQSTPYGSIAQAIQAAATGQQIAVAAGTYDEQVVVSGKAVRLWGRCPERVLITSSADFTIDLVGGAHGSEVHNVSVTAPSVAIAVSDAVDVLIEGVWVREAGFFGIDIENTLGPASAMIVNSLIERATSAGLAAFDAPVVVDGLEVRDTRAAADGSGGRGVSVQAVGPTAESRFSRSVFVRNLEAGAVVVSASASFDSCVFDDNLPQASTQLAGRGLSATGAQVTVDRSVFRRNTDAGLHLAVDTVASVRRSVVSDTNSSSTTMRYGQGIVAQGASQVDISDCLITRNRDGGVVDMGTAVSVSRSIVRDTSSAADGLFGDGLVIVRLADSPVLSVSDCLISGAARAGIASFGAAITLAGTQLECNVLHLSGEEEAGAPYAFDNLGGNRCGCGDEQVDCMIQSVGLSAPVALD